MAFNNTIRNLPFLYFLLPGHYLWNRLGDEEKMVGLKNMRLVLGEVAKKYLHKVDKIVFQNIMHLKQFQMLSYLLFLLN